MFFSTEIGQVNPELNRIYVGDCVEIMKSWPAGFVDMIWTDPPYGHNNANGDFGDCIDEKTRA